MHNQKNYEVLLKPLIYIWEEVGDNLSGCVLNLLAVVSALSSLVAKWSGKFFNGSCSRQVSILPDLVAMDTVVVELWWL